MNNATSQSILCLLSVVILFSAGCSSSKNNSETLSGKIVVPNGDFESGAMTPWVAYQSVQPSLSSDNVHGGKFSLAEAQANGSVYQDLKGLHSGTDYIISAWAYADPSTTATAQIAAYDPIANVATFSSAVAPIHGWQMLTHRVTVKSDGTLRIHLFRNQGSGIVYWDDVDVSPAK